MAALLDEAVKAHNQSTQDTQLFSPLDDVTISHPICAGKMPKNLNIDPIAVLRAAWATKLARLRPYLQKAGPGYRLCPVLISTLGGWHLESDRSMISLIPTFASR